MKKVYSFGDGKAEGNAHDKNIRVGDIITELGTEKISSLDEYNKVLESYKSGDALMIRIISNGNPRYEAFEINWKVIQMFDHILLQ